MTKDEILALQVGRELDALVAEKVMGWIPEGKNWVKPSGWPIDRVPNYSTDISAAWEVVELMKDKLQIFTYFKDEEGFDNGWLVKIDGKHVSGVDTAPEAICKAALLAVMENLPKAIETTEQLSRTVTEAVSGFSDQIKE